MEIVEQRDQWEATYRSNWLAHFEQTGQIKWSLYNRPNNKQAPAGPAIDLASSRIMFISSAGGYLPATLNRSSLNSGRNFLRPINPSWLLRFC